MKEKPLDIDSHAIDERPCECVDLSAEFLDSPLLGLVGRLAKDLLNMGFLIVHPVDNRWKQNTLGGSSVLPEFCRLIQSTEEGLRHCQMCHTLLAVAACSGGLTETRCHAGASLLLNPISAEDEQPLVVLTSCVFSLDGSAQVEKKVPSWVMSSSFSAEQFKDAYDSLPKFTSDQLEIARAVLAIASEALRETKNRVLLEEKLSDLLNQRKPVRGVQALVERELKAVQSIPASTYSRGSAARQKDSKDAPALVRIVAEMVSLKPGMPYTVEEIAAAARMTPNHFSSLFRKHQGMCFSDFLTQERIALAKNLLSDLTLSINEVAQRVGYENPGYFTRRFKQKTKMTPQKWRSSLGQK